MNTVEIQVNAKDNTSAAFKSAENAGLSASKTIATSFSKAGGLMGGELGGVLGSISAGLDDVGEHAVSMGTKLLVGGAAGASLGLLLGQIGSTEKAASQQLDAAIQQTGSSVSDYSKQIDAAVNKGEDFGHSATDVENALAQLTEATGDTSTALSYMTLVENLAAAKHESLASAAQTVTMVLGGNTRVLKQYGIDLGSGTHTTQELTDALNQLSVKLTGQASAASDTFMGHLTSMEQHAQQFIATIGNDVAPGLTVLGSALAIAGAGMDIQAARAQKAAAAQTALAAANLGEAGSAGVATGANTELATSETALASSSKNAADSSLLAKVGIGGLATAAAAGYLELANLTKQTYGSAAGFLALASPVANMTLGLSALAVKIDNFLGIGKQVAGVGTEIAPPIDAAAVAADNSAESMSGAAMAADALANAYYDAAGAAAAISGQMASYAGQAISASNANISVALGQDNLNTSFANFNQTLNGGGGTKQSVAAVINEVQDYSTAIDELSGNNVSAAQAQDKFALSLLGLKDSLAAATPLNQQTSSVEGSTVGAINNKEAILAQIDAINQIADAQMKAGVATKTVTSTMAANEQQLETSAAAAGLNASEVDDLIKQFAVDPGQLPVKVRSDEAAAAALAAKQATDSYSGSIAAQTPKVTANRDAFLQQLQAINQEAQQMLDAGVPIDKVNAKLGANEKALELAGEKAGMTKHQVQGLVAEYGTLATAVNQSVQTGVLKALSMMTDPNAQVNFIAGLAVSDPALFRQLMTPETHQGSGGYSHGGVWGAATGGNRGGEGVINEAGAEAVKLPNGSMVFSHADTQRMLSGGGGGGAATIQATLHVAAGADNLAGQFIMGLARAGLFTLKAQYVTP